MREMDEKMKKLSKLMFVLVVGASSVNAFANVLPSPTPSSTSSPVSSTEPSKEPVAPEGCWKESYGKQPYADGVFWAFVDTTVVSKDDLIAVISQAYSSFDLNKSFPSLDGTMIDFSLTAYTRVEGDTREHVQQLVNEEIRKLLAMKGVTVSCMPVMQPYPAVTGNN